MKRNTLTTAILAGLTGMAGMVSVSNAVNVNPDGLGQVLLYPYYSARGDNDTLISIVNTTNRGKAVKIRFIEALNSREVLDFNIYMSPFDVWTAGVTANDEGGAKMITADTTCTVPYIFGDFDGEQNFLTFEFTGENADGGPTAAERTASGYIEVIEMGTMVATPESGPVDDEIIPYSAKHVAGVPRDCDFLVDQWTANLPGGDLEWVSGNTTFGFDTEIGASGGLFGAASIINIPQGTMFSYNATAIDGFWEQGTTFHTNPGDLDPDLTANGFSPYISNVFVNGQVVTHDWSTIVTGASADVAGLNAVLAYSQLMNEYITDPGIGARTEWVLTFPTKRFHTDAAGGYVLPDQPLAPFTRTWNWDGTDLDLACEDFAFTTPTSFDGYYETNGSRAFDREERPDFEPEPEDDPVPPVVSPRPPADDDTPPEPDVFQLCREANVIRFSGTDGEPPAVSEILGEAFREGNGLGYSNFGLPFDAGWVRMDLAEIGVSGNRRVSEPGVNTANGAVQGVEGLPVVGFSVTTYTNGTLDGGAILANYGGTFNHRGSRSIVDVELED
jgi:hypothetical protein